MTPEIPQIASTSGPRTPRRRVLAVSLVGLLSVGVVSFYYASTIQAAPPKTGHTESKEEVPGNHAPALDVKPETSANVAPPPLSVRMEQAILSGSYVKGLKLAAEWRMHADEPSDAAWLYWEGLCFEGQKNWREARRCYKSAWPHVEGESRSALRLALARCAVQLGNRGAAEREIRHVALQETSAKWQRECLYHLALLADAFAEPIPKPTPFDSTVLACPEFQIAPETVLNRLPVVAVKPDKNQMPQEETKQDEENTNVHHHITRSQWYEAMQVAYESDGTHPSATAARLIRALSWHTAGQVAKARDEYVQIRKSATSAAILSVAAYNHGLLELHEWQPAACREAFLDLVDRNPGSRWERLGWWWIGRLELDDGKLTESRRAWNRASASMDREITCAIGVGQIMLDVLNKDENVEERYWSGPSWRNAPGHEYAEFLAAYFRHRQQPTSNRAQVLITAIRDAGYLRAFGPAGILVAGDALALCDQQDREIALYEQTIPKTRGSWAADLTLRVADNLNKQGNTSMARQRYLTVAKTNDAEAGDQARLALAELANKAGDGKSGLHYIQSLLTKTGVDRARILNVMGRSYELLGEYRKAAACYGGQLATAN